MTAFVARPRHGRHADGQRAAASRRRTRTRMIVAAEPLQGELVQGLRSLEDGYIPPIIDLSLLDRKIFVSNRDAIVWTKKLLEEEGLFVGVSTGAIASICVRVAERARRGQRRLRRARRRLEVPELGRLQQDDRGARGRGRPRVRLVLVGGGKLALIRVFSSTPSQVAPPERRGAARAPPRRVGEDRARPRTRNASSASSVRSFAAASSARPNGSPRSSGSPRVPRSSSAAARSGSALEMRPRQLQPLRARRLERGRPADREHQRVRARSPRRSGERLAARARACRRAASSSSPSSVKRAAPVHHHVQLLVASPVARLVVRLHDRLAGLRGRCRPTRRSRARRGAAGSGASGARPAARPSPSRRWRRPRIRAGLATGLARLVVGVRLVVRRRSAIP